MRTLVLLLLVAVVSSKVFERCEWARTMRFYGLDGYYNHTLADWLCLTSSVSNFNTSAITHRYDGAKFYGIFQVKGDVWCNDDNPKSASCGVGCTELLTDDVRVAIKCAQTILGDQGLKAWGTWTYECENRDLSSYLDGCEIPCIPN